jgi:excinuclease ABC subunit B
VQKSVDNVRFVTRVADAREEREEGDEAPARGRGRGRGRDGGKKGESRQPAAKVAERTPAYDTRDPQALVAQLEAEMREAAKALDFEQAARLRDQLFEVKARAGSSGGGGGSARPAGLAAIRAER